MNRVRSSVAGVALRASQSLRAQNFSTAPSSRPRSRVAPRSSHRASIVPVLQQQQQQQQAPVAAAGAPGSTAVGAPGQPGGVQTVEYQRPSLGQMVVEGMTWGVGSAIAHRAVDGIMGPRTINVEHVPSSTNAAAGAVGGEAASSPVDGVGVGAGAGAGADSGSGVFSSFASDANPSGGWGSAGSSSSGGWGDSAAGSGSAASGSGGWGDAPSTLPEESSFFGSILKGIFE